MPKEWKEWYLQDGKYKVCRGTFHGEQEVSLYERVSEAPIEYQVVVQIIGMSALATDMYTAKLIEEYDTEKVFSKGTGLGTPKAGTGN